MLEQCATATPLLLHCTHGKDRTGLVSALVLHVCGASRDAIVADYTASNEWGCSVEGRYIMEQMMPARLAGLFELDPWCEAPPEAIEEVFAKQAKYGSVDAYLDGIGFGATQRQRLRDRLMQEATTSSSCYAIYDFAGVLRRVRRAAVRRVAGRAVAVAGLGAVLGAVGASLLSASPPTSPRSSSAARSHSSLSAGRGAARAV